MTKRMLIDSTHAEETRVVVLDGNRLEDFDVETSTKQQLKGNIYLAKVVRVEPSLQAAFVEYGGNRHGFLAFGEIHPDYYQIPVADRQRLLEMQEAEAREDEEAEERAAVRDAARESGVRPPRESRPATLREANGAAPAYAGADVMDAMDAMRGADPVDDMPVESPLAEDEPAVTDQAEPDPMPEPGQVAQAAAIAQDIIVAPDEAASLFPDSLPIEPTDDTPAEDEPADIGIDMVPEAEAESSQVTAPDTTGEPAPDLVSSPAIEASLDEAAVQHAYENGADEPPPESIGGEPEETREQRAPPRFLRNYKIQEVIRRRQILLIQVVKEERGSKGAALTTYVSLAGRFSVLMPNSPRGGGISRKITSAADRRRLKEVTTELDLPRGMGLIVRTAGANRPKPEIIRDCEYLLNQWDQIRDLTMKSMAPALIYEEASLIKRAIRDVYSRDVDDILVDGEQGWRAARDFMRMLMPTHARKVQLWKDPQPLFVKAQVEQQLDAMLVPTVQLKSGGYLVINQTEALVAIDVNSGRSTRERGIEETALKTNLEAADEAARQLRLRDLAGLIVIDFIDMESRRNNTAVEARLKAALKVDRARIQVGSISHFGLLEMSRQRLRPSLTETSFVMCPHCAGTGQVRSTESASLHVLRSVEEEGAKRRAAEVIVHVAGSIALYVLNHKRVRLGEIEARYGMKVSFAADDSLLPPNVRIDRVRAKDVSELPPPISQLAPPEPFEDPDEEVMDQAADAAPDSAEDQDDDEAPRPGETAAETEQRSKRRRRRRRGGRREDGDAPAVTAEPGDVTADATLDGAEPSDDDAPAAAADGTEPSTAEDAERTKRRGRRGGRRRRREPGEAAAADGAEGASDPDATAAMEPTVAAPYVAPAYVPYVPPPYVGPTPANPFGGASAFDIFDAIEQAEQERALAATAPRRPEPVDVEAQRVEAIEPEPLPESLPESEPVIAEPVALAPETVSIADPVPEPVPEPVPASMAEPEPAPAPVAAPLVVPTIIDGTDALAEKKRGWWRR